MCLPGNTSAWTDWNGWYVVSESVETDTRITVSGLVNLILCDGVTLSAKKGITAEEGNTLNIYGQINGTGKPAAMGKDNCDAGIGGTKGENAGTINIYGGDVNATGYSGAGIGGGQGGNGGSITLPHYLRKYFRTSNHIERLNKKPKRRSRVIGIFPNEASLMRLMGSVLVERNEEIISRKCIFTNKIYQELLSTDVPAPMPERNDNRYYLLYLRQFTPNSGLDWRNRLSM